MEAKSIKWKPPEHHRAVTQGPFERGSAFDSLSDFQIHLALNGRFIDFGKPIGQFLLINSQVDWQSERGGKPCGVAFGRDSCLVLLGCTLCAVQCADTRNV